LIYYSLLKKQQRKGTKHVYKCEDIKQKKTTVKSTSELRMYPHWNQQATSERRKNRDRTNGQTIWGFQCR